MSTRPTLLLPLLFAIACAGPGYRVPAPPAGWQRLGAEGDSFAYHNAGGGTMAANVTCDSGEDVPLDVFTNHLLFGIEQRQERARTPITVDGRGALRTRIDGRLDGVPVALELVVLKKDGCVYDLFLIAPPGALTAHQPAFDRFLAGFAQVAKR